MKWQPILVFLPGKAHGQRRPGGYSPWSCKRLWHEWLSQWQYPCMVSLILKQASHRQLCTVESGWIQTRGQKFSSHYDPEQVYPLCVPALLHNRNKASCQTVLTGFLEAANKIQWKYNQKEHARKYSQGEYTLGKSVHIKTKNCLPLYPW